MGSLLTLSADERRQLARGVGRRMAHGRFPRMAYMELFITGRCSLNCGYCFVHKREEPDMTWDAAIQALEFYIEESGAARELGMLFFGGEPLLRMDFIKEYVPYALDRAKRAGKIVAFNVTTNGVHLTEETALALAKLQVKYLLSIDGMKEDHDRYRRVPSGEGTWDMIVGRLAMLKRYQPWQGARITPTPESVGRMCEGVKTLFEKGVNQFIVGAAHGLAWSAEDLREYMRQWKLLADFYCDQLRAKQYIRITTLDCESKEAEAAKTANEWGCGAGRGRVCVAGDGGLYGCSKLLAIRKDGAGLLRLGDVRTGWGDLAPRALLNDASLRRRSACAACRLRTRCTGGCPAVNWEATGDFFTCDNTNRKLAAIGVIAADYAYQRRSGSPGRGDEGGSSLPSCPMEYSSMGRD